MILKLIDEMSPHAVYESSYFVALKVLERMTESPRVKGALRKYRILASRQVAQAVHAPVALRDYSLFTEGLVLKRNVFYFKNLFIQLKS